jgi:hypothetical protein
MADSKISALPASTTPLAGTEVLPIVQSSATKQVTVANLTAGRAVATGALTVTGDATLSTGNIVQGTAAKGINFTANTPAAGMTSQLLNWYEEGTWTPTQGAGLIVVGAFTSSGVYTRVGRLVTVTFLLKGSTSVAATGVVELFAGLPYAGTGISGFGVGCNSTGGVTYNFQIIASSGYLEGSNISATTDLYGSATYSI